MTELFKDRYKTGLVLASLFMLGVILSLYSVYSIPHKLMLPQTFHPAVNSTYLILILTFLVGGLGLWYSLGYRNEIVVFKEKQQETKLTESNSNTGSQTTISLENVTTAIRQSSSTEAILTSGLQAICKQLDAGQGAVYAALESDGHRRVELKGGYALGIGENVVISFAFGEGLIGQAAAGARTLYVDEVPDGYVKIISGLGSASPRYLLIVPLKKNEKVLGVIEIASFTAVTDDQRKFVEESAQLMANAIKSN